MTTAILAGMGLGAGVLLLARVLVPARVPLDVAIARVDAAATRRAPRRSPSAVAPSGGRGVVGVLERVVGRRVAEVLIERGVLGSLRADLHLLGIDEAAYTTRKVMYAVAALVLTPVITAVVAAVTGLPWLLGAWLCLLLAAGAFMVPDGHVRRRATRRRVNFVAAMGSYLYLVAMRTASGSGLPEALRDAANIGTGFAFGRLRSALEDARLIGVSPTRALGMVGEDLEIPELVELSAQLMVVDDRGARAEESLRAKADALRDRQLSEAHGAANARSESMRVAQMLTGLGFLIFLGYPAVASVLAV